MLDHIHDLEPTRNSCKASVAAAWEALIARAPEQQREHLRPLAVHCAAHILCPEEVSYRTLHGLWTDINPDAPDAPVLEQVIASWNECLKRVPGWPPVHLVHPVEADPYLSPFSAFPSSFREDVLRFEAAMSDDPYQPDWTERERFLRGCRITFCRAASWMLQANYVSLEGINCLDALVGGDAPLGLALDRFRPHSETLETHGVHSMAIHLRAAARYSKLPETAYFEEMVDRTAPGVMRARGEDDHERLAQFRNPAAVLRLLRFPGNHFARARQEKNAAARADAMKAALAVALLIHAFLDPEDVRRLRLPMARKMARGYFLWDPDGLKWDREMNLPTEARGILREFLAGAGGIRSEDDQYLFPAADGGAMSRDAFHGMVRDALQSHAGLDVTPDLIRPIVAKVVLERAPSLLHDVYMMFGERPDDPYYDSRRPETEHACVRVNRVLEELCGGARPD